MGFDHFSRIVLRLAWIRVNILFQLKRPRAECLHQNPDGAIKEQSPQLELELVFNEKGEEATVFDNLIPHTAMEWKISEFFIAIGQKDTRSRLCSKLNVVGC